MIGKLLLGTYLFLCDVLILSGFFMQSIDIVILALFLLVMGLGIIIITPFPPEERK